MSAKFVSKLVYYICCFVYHIVWTKDHGLIKGALQDIKSSYNE